MQNDVKIPTMEKSSQFQFGKLEYSKYVFFQLGNSREFAWLYPPPTQSTFAIHINQIVAEFIKLPLHKVFQCVWNCFGGLKQILEIYLQS
jgi:hypothetical protein